MLCNCHNCGFQTLDWKKKTMIYLLEGVHLVSGSLSFPDGPATLKYNHVDRIALLFFSQILHERICC